MVDVASTSAYIASSLPMIPYDVSKGGVRQLTVSLAVHLGATRDHRQRHRARHHRHAPDARPVRHRDARSSAAGKSRCAAWAGPDDLVGAVVFLASDEAAYVTGHVLAVDGGRWRSEASRRIIGERARQAGPARLRSAEITRETRDDSPMAAMSGATSAQFAMVGLVTGGEIYGALPQATGGRIAEFLNGERGDLMPMTQASTEDVENGAEVPELSVALSHVTYVQPLGTPEAPVTEFASSRSAGAGMELQVVLRTRASPCAGRCTCPPGLDFMGLITRPSQPLPWPSRGDALVTRRGGVRARRRAC